MLSAKELFRYRSALEKTVPQKGGNKDFMPDGSWLQNKRLEKFYDERQTVLAEPRVQRKCDWVRGDWNPESQLVELYQAVKNFFEHMGFVDNQRKWLYPEEALVLMEMSILELWYQDLPLSIQQAHQLLLADAQSVQLYQVYSHLRRVGYIVVRHQGRLDVTRYEQQIGLDKYTSKKIKKTKRKQKVKDKPADVATSGDDIGKDSNQHGMNVSPACSPEQRGTDTDIDHTADILPDQQDTSAGIRAVDKGFEQDNVVRESRETGDPGRLDSGKTETSDRLEAVALDTRVALDTIALVGNKGDIKQDGNADICTMKTSETECVVSSGMDKGAGDGADGNCRTMDANEWTHLGTGDGATPSTRKLSQWDFREIAFPNFSSDTDVITIPSPDVSKLPGDVDRLNNSEYQFVKKNFINTARGKRKFTDIEDEILEFSYSKVFSARLERAKSSRNWKEYKSQVEKERESFDSSQIVPHLYSNGLSPLVNPEHSTSTSSVLEQLYVVKDEAPKSKCDSTLPSVLPDFDVYSPNMQYKKSYPGMPDHRVCVCRYTDPLPELPTIQAMNDYLRDEVPLHWAVIDNGDISFYAMSDFLLPQDINIG